MKRILHIFLLTFFFVNAAHSQKINDLLSELKVADDTTKVIILNELFDAHFILKETTKKKSKAPTYLDKAHDYAQKALKLAEELRYKQGMALAYHNLGKYYLKKKDNRGAELSFLNSVELAKEVREHELVLKNLNYIFDFNKTLGNANNTIVYADMKSDYKDVIINELKSEKNKILSEQAASLKKVGQKDSLLKVEHAKLNTALEKIKSLETAAAPEPVVVVENKVPVTWIVIFIMVSGVLAGLFIKAFLKNNTSKQLLKDAEKNISLLEKKLSELNRDAPPALESEVLKIKSDIDGHEEMNLKITQLLTQANFIIQKNEILLQLENNYNGLKSSKVEDLSDKVTALGVVINSSYDARKDWEGFITHFEAVYPNYLRELKARNSKLEELELKVAALSKVDLTFREMSRILHLPEGEIEKVYISLNKRLKVKAAV